MRLRKAGSYDPNSEQEAQQAHDLQLPWGLRGDPSSMHVFKGQYQRPDGAPVVHSYMQHMSLHLWVLLYTSVTNAYTAVTTAPTKCMCICVPIMFPNACVSMSCMPSQALSATLAARRSASTTFGELLVKIITSTRTMEVRLTACACMHSGDNRLTCEYASLHYHVCLRSLPQITGSKPPTMLLWTRCVNLAGA